MEMLPPSSSLLMHAGGKLVIVNLQKTPKDKKANLVIHARCDDLMSALMCQLQHPLPSYTRQDAVLVSHSLKKGKQLLNGTQRYSCTISVESIHGPKCPMPLIQQIELQFEVSMLPYMGICHACL